MNRIAITTARAEWVLYKPKHGVRRRWHAREARVAKQYGDLTQVDDHPVLDLLRKPCPFFPGVSTRKLLRVYREIVGESFQIRERNGAGMTVQLWPVPTHWCKGIPTMEVPRFRFQQGRWNKELEPEHVIWTRDLDPEMPYGRGSGLGSSLEDDLNGDKYAAQLFASQLANRNMPDAIVSLRDTDGERLPGETVDQVEASWERDHNAITGKGKRLRFTSGEVKVQPLGVSFVEAQVAELRKTSRAALLESLSIPPELMGIMGSSNRATSYVSRMLFTEQVIEPRLDQDCDEYQSELVDEWDEGLILAYDSPRPEDVESVLALMRDHPHAFLIDDIRGQGGLAEMENGEGKKLAVKAGTQFVESYDQVVQAKPATPEPDPAKRGQSDPPWVADLDTFRRRLGA